MSTKDIKTEVMFSATVAVPNEEIARAKTHDLMGYKKDSVARDLGIKIAHEKHWHEQDEDHMKIATMRLYVFTPVELRIYMEAEFKDKLQRMAFTEQYLSPEQREALMIQSERF